MGLEWKSCRRPTPLNMRASIGAAIAGLLWFNTCGAAQPSKKPYELQERCDKRAADLFEREYRPLVENTKDVLELRKIMSVSPGMLLKSPNPMTCQSSPTLPRK